MPTREPELYKDKIEVSLDGRQIFYLFFGGAVIVGLVFVLGVLVGRRVESRGHLDRAATQTAVDPLAALDRLERTDQLSFHGALTGGEPHSDVEKAIADLEKRRAATRPEPRPEAKSEAKSEGKPEARLDAKPEAKLDGKHEARPDSKPEGKSDMKAEARSESERAERKARHGDETGEVRSADAGRPVTRPDGGAAEVRAQSKADKSDKSEARSDKAERADKSEKSDRSEARNDRSERSDRGEKSERGDKAEKSERGDKAEKPERGDKAEKSERGDKSERADKGEKSDKAEARSDKSEARSDKADGKPSSEARVRFTLQLSSFQDRAEAEAFLATMKSAGFQPYVTEAEVSGKGTFYRVRLGSYRSLEAANDAKLEFEKSSKKTAQVMRL